MSITCTQCLQPLPATLWNSEKFVPCPSCKGQLQAIVFPASQRQAEAPHFAEPTEDASEASCYFHAGKRPEASCGRCGRFVCRLCHVAMGGESLCGQCVDTAREEASLDAVAATRMLYGNLALAAAVIPIITIWGTLFGAPIALYIIRRYGKQPSSLLKPRQRWKFIVAGLFAWVQVATWLAGLGYLFYLFLTYAL